MSVCLNHPDRETEIRCVACQKPICGECAIEDEASGRTFCSVECQAKAEFTKEGVTQFQDSDAAARKRSLIKKVIAFIIFIAIVVGIVAFLQTEQGKKLWNKHVKDRIPATQTEKK